MSESDFIEFNGTNWPSKESYVVAILDGKYEILYYRNNGFYAEKTCPDNAELIKKGAVLDAYVELPII